MNFDDEVDDARRRLEAAREADKDRPAFDDLAALQKMLPKLVGAIQSRRLSFALTDDPEETTIEVIHTPSEEVLGYVYAEDGEYVFESNLEDYFDDFVDEDADTFVSRLYETLRADLPKFEVEVAEGDDD